MKTYSRAGDDQRTAFRTARKHTLVRSDRHHRAPEVVSVIVVCSVVVLDVGVEGLVADRASIVLDLVLGIDKITPRKTKVLSSLIRLTLEKTLRGRGLEAAREAGDWATGVVPNRWWLRRVSRLVRKRYENC